MIFCQRYETKTLSKAAPPKYTSSLVKFYNKKKEDYMAVQKEVKLYLTQSKDKLVEILKVVIQMKGVNAKKLSTAQKLGKVFNDFLEFQDMLAKKVIKATAI